MKKFMKFLVAMVMGIVFVACGDSDIDGVKGAYKEHMSDARPGLEWLINSARISGANKASNLENFFNDIDQFLMRNPNVGTALEPAFSALSNATDPEDSGRVVKVLQRIKLDEKDVRNMANTILASGVNVPKKVDIDSCDWWEFEKDGTKYVAAGDKKTGYVLFKILDDGEQFMLSSLCWKNVSTGEMEEASLENFMAHENILYSLVITLLVYNVDDGAIAKDINK